MAMIHCSFHYLLQSLRRFTHTVATSGVPGVNRDDLHGIMVVLPPKAEQDAIAEALSDADAFIASLEQLIAKKRQVKQGAMQELLTGRRRLPGFSGEWEVKRLGEVVDYSNVVRLLQPVILDEPIWFDQDSTYSAGFWSEIVGRYEDTSGETAQRMSL